MSTTARNTTEGHTFSGKPKTVTLERMRGFSGWPVKNIHTDVEYAKACGLSGPIASGTMFQTYLTELMIDYFGADWLGNGGIKVAFTRAVEPGDIITPKGTVEKQESTEAGKRVDLRVWCENQRGEPVVVGTAFGVAR
ncbi:MAG: MaoC family dehydratase [Dehalococcoidia bacterium]|jgi:acyl dehydratase|nr:MaoC family dehydratase [Dehalococcoidia bacterium]MDP6229063.1 MaoC family dehydratase [Dehalococcoidia bacterium]MDP7083166.1 MaoC family dehydratase [Dehalococcoidia bacterium]MDP7199954.1 MaoC family dehydratase [Dehalococcoidia bacterium]MDP7509991.1 MaoC family dehydratase [Dehalococcoidia bacterium]